MNEINHLGMNARQFHDLQDVVYGVRFSFKHPNDMTHPDGLSLTLN